MEPIPKLPKKKKHTTCSSLDQDQDQDQDQLTPSHFSFIIMKISVSQICQSVGYRATHLSALENLTHIAAKYLQAIATSAAAYANNSNRTESNAFDIINGLHDLLSAKGFPGSSILHRGDYRVLGSSAVTEVANFVKRSVETPFAKPIPRSDSGVKSIPYPSGEEEESEESIGRGSHIPKWLPQYPKAKEREGKLVEEMGRNGNGEELWEKSKAVKRGNGSCEIRRGVGVGVGMGVGVGVGGEEKKDSE